jgi:hypothetical protein
MLVVRRCLPTPERVEVCCYFTPSPLQFLGFFFQPLNGSKSVVTRLVIGVGSFLMNFQPLNGSKSVVTLSESVEAFENEVLPTPERIEVCCHAIRECGGI